jgi:hypothetical protein
MPEDIALYRIFIATPGGLDQERRAFVQTLDRYNVAEAMHRQAMFFPVGWEDTLAGAGRPQSLIDRDLDKCDYFVMVLWDRWGSPPGDPQYTSGTEEEYRLAMAHLQDSKHPLRQVVVFFKAIEDPKLIQDPGEQLKKVLTFKKELEASRSVLFYTFADIEEFRERLRRHLAEWLREHDRTSTTREARERARVPEPIDIPKPFIAPGVVAMPDAGSPEPGPLMETRAGDPHN